LIWHWGSSQTRSTIKSGRGFSIGLGVFAGTLFTGGGFSSAAISREGKVKTARRMNRIINPPLLILPPLRW
jgi:hypothetical protein